MKVVWVSWGGGLRIKASTDRIRCYSQPQWRPLLPDFENAVIFSLGYYLMEEKFENKVEQIKL